MKQIYKICLAVLILLFISTSVFSSNDSTMIYDDIIMIMYHSEQSYSFFMKKDNKLIHGSFSFCNVSIELTDEKTTITVKYKESFISKFCEDATIKLNPNTSFNGVGVYKNGKYLRNSYRIY